MAKLIVTCPDGRVFEVELKQQLYTIGRDKSNRIILESEEVSPRQAEIEASHDSYFITDLSENKTTTVNGTRIKTQSLQDGDRITFGPVSALFSQREEAPTQKSSSPSLVVGVGLAVVFLAIAVSLFFLGRKLLSESSQDILNQKNDAVSFEMDVQTPGESRALPEHGRAVIAERQARAVPRGLKRLFFRKIPVVVETQIDKEEDQAFTSGIAPAEKKTEGQKTVREEAFDSEGRREGTASVIKRALVAAFVKITRKIESVITSEKTSREQVIGPTVVEPAEQREEDAPKKREYMVEPGTEEIVSKLTEPQDRDAGVIDDFMSRVEIPELREPSFKEGPVYSEEEVERIKEKQSDDRLSISKRKSVNIIPVWNYRGGQTETEQVIRTGTLGRIDNDKSFDYLFGTRGGRLIAVSGKDGEEIFVKELNKPFYEPIVEDFDRNRKNDILIIYEDGEMILYTRDFSLLWNYEAREEISSVPLLADLNKDRISDIVFPTLGMDIIALDGASGFELWKFFDAESETEHAPAGVDLNEDSIRDVLFVTAKGFMYALDGKTGWGLWKREIFGAPAGSCSIGDLDGDNRYDIVALAETGILTGYRYNGSLLFLKELEGSYRVAPSIGDTDGDGIDEIVLIDKRGILRAIEGRTRRDKWRFDTEEPYTRGRLALVDINNDRGMDVVLNTPSGLLFVIDGKSGKQLALYNIENYMFTTPTVFDVNRDRLLEIVSAGYSGDVFAIQIPGTKRRLFSLMRTFWVSSNHDKYNTGHSSRFILKNSYEK